jgi:hypothetical protein
MNWSHGAYLLWDRVKFGAFFAAIYTMAAQYVEVIKMAGSCEPRGPTQSAFLETFPDEQEFPVEPQQMMTPAEKDEARVLKRRIGKYKSLFPQGTVDFDQGTLDSLDIE